MSERADAIEEPLGSERPWEAEFETELTAQKRAEAMLMARGATILLVVSILVVIRSLLL